MADKKGEKLLYEQQHEGSSNYPPPYPGHNPAPLYNNQPYAPQYGQPNVVMQGQPQYQVLVQQPGAGQNTYIVAQNTEPPPPDFLGYAIFVTICCCWPIGIIAILKAADSRAATARGDIQSAKMKSQEAKKMSNIALGVGISMLVLSIFLMIVYICVIINSISY